jgi:hypothetical protein
VAARWILRPQSSRVETFGSLRIEQPVCGVPLTREEVKQAMKGSPTRGNRRSSARTAAAAVLLILLVTPPTALAGGAPPPPDEVFKAGGLKYAMTRVDAGSGAAIANLEVPCEGRRWQAVGGGADVVEGFAPAVHLNRSGPFDLTPAEGGDQDLKPDDGWGAYVRQSSGPDFTVDVWAVCAKKAKPRYRLKTRDFGMNEGRTAKASCRDNHLLGGGFFIAPLLVSEMSVSLPFDGSDKNNVPGDGWMVRGFNSTGPSATLGAHAICTQKGGLSYASKSAPAPAAPEVLTRTVNCPSGAKVASGGGSVRSGHIIESHPSDDGDPGKAPDDGWRTTLLAGTAFKPSMFAVCLR